MEAACALPTTAPAAACQSGPVLLVRRLDVGRTQRGVHVVQLPQPEPDWYITAEPCALRLHRLQVESVDPGTGMPCERCLPAMAVLAAAQR